MPARPPVRSLATPTVRGGAGFAGAPARALAGGPSGGLRTVANVTFAAKGDKIVLWTMPAPTTLKAERGDDDVLSSALIQLG